VVFKKIRSWFNVKVGKSANGSQLLNPGGFWCSRHWGQIVRSQSDLKYAIDPTVAAIGVGQALNIKYDHKLEGPLQNACDMLPKEILDGILERSKGWL
jgi:hypothetical protein